MNVFPSCVSAGDGLVLDVLDAPVVVSVEDFCGVAPSVSSGADSIAGVSSFSELKSVDL